MGSQPTFPFSSIELFRALTALVTPLGVQGSAGHLFKGAIFGRDSLRVALDVLPWFPAIVETVIFSLAHLQATGPNAVTDAKHVGQIPHEARFLYIGPRKIGEQQERILGDLAGKWGAVARVSCNTVQPTQHHNSSVWSGPTVASMVMTFSTKSFDAPTGWG